MLQLVREELHPGDPATLVVETERTSGQEVDSRADEDEDVEKISGRVIPYPPRRLTRVQLDFNDLSVAKTNNLQPYLFKVLQDQDAGAEVRVTVEVNSEAGIPEDILNERIVEAFDQLGITVRWEEG